MTPETEKNVNEAIDWLQKTGGSIQDFAVEQAPLYCREVVQWQLWYNAAWLIFSLTFLVVAILKGKRLVEMMKSNDDGEFWISLFAFILIFFGFAIPFTESIGPFIKAAVAPRLVIVEHLRGLKP